VRLWCQKLARLLRLNRPPTEVVVSLGTDCTPALVARELGLRQASFPFDWLETPLDSAIELMLCRFDGFLDPSQLQVIRISSEDWYKPIEETAYLFQTRWKLAHHHETISGNTVDPVEIEKYRRRCQRLMELVDSGRKITFLRMKKYELQYDYEKWNAGNSEALKQFKQEEHARSEQLDVDDLEALVEDLEQMSGHAGQFRVLYVCSDRQIPESRSGKVSVYSHPVGHSSDTEKWSFEACRAALKCYFSLR